MAAVQDGEGFVAQGALQGLGGHDGGLPLGKELGAIGKGFRALAFGKLGLCFLGACGGRRLGRLNHGGRCLDGALLGVGAAHGGKSGPQGQCGKCPAQEAGRGEIGGCHGFTKKWE